MATTLSLPLLERARVSAPCPAKWEDMTGDDKVRHCALCNLSVHNFAEMTPGEANAILSRHFNPDGSAITGAGRVCGMLARRADGTYLLQDCPVGLAALRIKVRSAWIRVAAAIGLLGTSAALLESRAATPATVTGNVRGEIAVAPAARLAQSEPFHAVWAFLRGTKPVVQPPVMGDICIPPAPATTAAK